MKLSTLFVALAVSGTHAFPGMKNLLTELMKRQAAPPLIPEPLIGDLATKGATTPVGKAVLACLNDQIGTSCQTEAAKTYTPPGLLGTFQCAADVCCVWDYVVKDLVKLFVQCDGTCGPLARQAVRFGFHDASAWHQNASYGGADGSLFLSPTEINRSENNGMQSWRIQGLLLLAKYAAFGVGAADLAQFAHNVATVVCPLGPRIMTLVGRPSSIVDNLPNLLPNQASPANELIELFQNKTVSFVDLTALIGAHTAAQQFFVDTTKAGQPLDSTPGIWDVKFYSEVLAGTPPAGVFRLQSDNALAADNETNGGFHAFSAPTTGQDLWNSLYSRAYLRMSLFGVNNINQLQDCTKVLPSYQETFSGTGTGLNPQCNGQKQVTTTSVATSTIYTTKVYTTSLCLPLLPCPSILQKVVTTTYPIATTTYAVTQTATQAWKRVPKATAA